MESLIASVKNYLARREFLICEIEKMRSVRADVLGICSNEYLEEMFEKLKKKKAVAANRKAQSGTNPVDSYRLV